MLPPIDDSILQANPKFAALHGILAEQILTPNGSTKLHPAQKERDAVTKALKTCRIRNAKSQLLKSALRNLDLSSPTPSSTASKPARQSQTQAKPPTTLPPELLELILLLSSRLSSNSISPAQSRLLESSTRWASLRLELPRIGSLVSTHLQTQALSLCRILTPSTNSSFLHRNIPKLLSSITTLQNEISSKRAELSDRRTALVTHTTTLLTLYHLGTALAIRILEQTAHGALSRHIKARSEFLGLKAQQVLCQAGEKRAQGERMVYTEEVQNALVNYVRELRVGMERGRERRRMAERTLWGYGVGRGDEGEGKERVLKSVARAYGELIKEVEEVGRDVERLRGR
ncbi:hypothetical protein B2J93_3196 [Marssonina coronariae]|uniref:Uncharacterized protein n=1 Tax=Diplocarpon coronariae TaxID=2795749 RepID=A0A218Z361_9HELO|nr:hypothetical protein B2J93_3196 [Marssonina coronariae]